MLIDAPLIPNPKRHRRPEHRRDHRDRSEGYRAPIAIESNGTFTAADVKGLPEGLTVTDIKTENGKTTGRITGTPTKAGAFNVTVTAKRDGAEATSNVKFAIDEGQKQKEVDPRCIATAVGLGVPLLALIPIGLLVQSGLPGLKPVADQVSVQIEAFNEGIQRQLGVFNPAGAKQAVEINARLREVGLDFAKLAGGLALIAAGILSTTLIVDYCRPDGPKIFSSDTKVEGSSGKTYQPSDKNTEASKSSEK